MMESRAELHLKFEQTEKVPHTEKGILSQTLRLPSSKVALLIVCRTQLVSTNLLTLLGNLLARAFCLLHFGSVKSSKHTSRQLQVAFRDRAGC